MNKTMLKAVIVDDEESSRITLRNMLTDFCENVNVVGEADSVSEAIKQINTHHPDVVFLDIEMPEQNGFKLFDYYLNPTFEVIFTTAYNQYAVKAFRLSALDYLLKPIDLEQLRDALKKLKEKKDHNESIRKVSILKENLNNVLKKLALPTADGFIFIEIGSIIRCEASGNYTLFHFKNGEKVLVSKTLKIYDDLLSEFNFFRINRSNLINLNMIEKYGRQKNATITMTDGSILSISDSRKRRFLQLFRQNLNYFSIIV